MAFLDFAHARRNGIPDGGLPRPRAYCGGSRDMRGEERRSAAAPPPSPIGELNERSREIFRLIVDSYVHSGEPVGSRTLSRLLTQNLSPATIRNVMADL